MVQHLFTAKFANPEGSPIRELFPYLSKPGMISFAGGYPSSSLFDAEGLEQAVKKALTNPDLSLQYGATEGVPLLKEQLASLNESRGIVRPHSELVVTTGSQQAFDLLLRVFVEPGDTVLVEAPAYTAAIQALRLAGATILEVPIDHDGLRTDVLATILEETRHRAPKLLYTVPSFSNPSGTLLSEVRRQELVKLAMAYRFLIVEDDPYGELAFDAIKPKPLVVHGSEIAGSENPVVYLSSLSKTVAPGLRIGWLVAPPEIARRCAIAKQTNDLCTSPLNQVIAAEYLALGRYAVNVERAKGEYGRRVSAMAGALEEKLRGRLSFVRPRGGMFLWAERATPLDPKRFFAACVDAGVLFVPGSVFFPTSLRPDSMRLSFAGPTTEEIEKGVERLEQAFARASA